MKTMDTAGLRPLGPPDRGPWMVADDRLLKTTCHGVPLSSVVEAETVFDAYRGARDAGAATPAPIEVVRVSGGQGGYGVVVEYVRGLPLTAHLAFGSFTPTEAGRALADLLRGLHGLVSSAGRDYDALFRRRSRALAPHLVPEVADGLVALVDAIPASRSLLHGDLHYGNVVVRDGVPVAIDLELAGFGNPVYDLATTRARLRAFADAPGRGDALTRASADSSPEVRCRAMWEALAAAYGEGRAADGDGRALLLTAALAEVADCCHRFGLDEVDEARWTPQQHRRLEICEGRLEALLPALDGPCPTCGLAGSPGARDAFGLKGCP